MVSRHAGRLFRSSSMAEHSAVNRRVVSSSLTCGARLNKGRWSQSRRPFSFDGHSRTPFRKLVIDAGNSDQDLEGTEYCFNRPPFSLLGGGSWQRELPFLPGGHSIGDLNRKMRYLQVRKSGLDCRKGSRYVARTLRAAEVSSRPDVFGTSSNHRGTMELVCCHWSSGDFPESFLWHTYPNL